MRFFLLSCLFLLLSFNSDTAAPAPPPGTFAKQWKAIDALLAKSKTATAAPLIDAICQQARQQQNTPAYVRALLYKIRLLQAKEEDADEKGIALLEKDLRTATFPARPILHSLLAELYTNYLAAHRYELYQRTAGATATRDSTATADGGTRLPTWDVAKIGAAIVRHYYLSVEDEPQRQLKTTLADLGDLATGGNVEGRALRPTLYDLLAHRAIDGLQNQELYVTRPEQQLELTDPQLFGSAAEFAALRLLAPEADSLNGQLHALHILQRLTASRQQLAPADLTALADVDLRRVEYLHGVVQRPEVAQLYGPALARLAQQYAALPISTEFGARRVELLNQTDAVAAVALAREVEATFPKSRGAVRARQMRESIEQPELHFSAANIIVPNQPWRLDVTARNIASLHAWAYRISFKEWLSSGGNDAANRPVARRYARALSAAPVASWAVPVPAHPLDYKGLTIKAAGAALPIGYYLVVVSNEATKPTAARPGLVTSYGFLGASELSVVVRRDPRTQAAQVLALHRQSGALLPATRVLAHYQHYDPEKRQMVNRPDQVVMTDAEGRAELPVPPVIQHHEAEMQYLRLTRGGDSLQREGVGRGPHYGMPGVSAPTVHMFLFTDRAIYRPGQTVYFKGILTEVNGQVSRLLPGWPARVQLVDVNGQTAQTLSFMTSDFGSFHGSLVLPTGLLNGAMHLKTDYGSIGFTVEDYKRPTFFVKLDSVPGRPRLGQPLTMTGRARAYAGQATDGATVSYRVTRRELLPMVYSDKGSYYPPDRGGVQEIAHGTTTTDAEGRFAITFTPPVVTKKVRRWEWQPGYLFELKADVTDAAGETRTGTRRLPIGRNPLSLHLAGPDKVDKQQPVPAFELTAANATGEALPVQGTVRLLARRFQPNPPGVPGPASETEGNEASPELVSTLAFDTNNRPAFDLRAALAGLPTGRYRLEALAAGADSARAQLDFTLYDSQAATVPFATPDWFVSLQDSVAPGQPTSILLGSSEANARILLEVERGGRLLRKEWLTLNAGEQRRLTVESGPATASDPLYIHTTQMRDNHLYRHNATVQVAEKPQPLRLDLSTFRDKLQPGQKETWRITVRQANGQPAEAELLATLYDQSLDVFRRHRLGGVGFGHGYYPAQFDWQGAFGMLYAQVWLEPGSAASADIVRYPMLLTEVAGGLSVGVGRGLMGGYADLSELSGTGLESKLARAAPGVQVRATAALGMMVENQQLNDVVVVGYGTSTRTEVTGSTSVKTTADPDLSAVPTRTDFRETAFWQPALRTDANGDVVLEFQMPEAVTRWQLLALAHDKTLHTGQLARQLVTQKAIQITPNAPRFLRQGDTFTFAARFSNLTEQPVSGTAQLFLLDAATGQDLTSQLLRKPAPQAVTAAARQSTALGWEISLPADFAPVAVTYRVVAQTGTPAEAKSRKRKTKNQQPAFSDGEENTLPVLPNKILITESLPLPIIGPTTRTFELQKLTSTSSPTRRHHSLTLEMTANPAWYAVQSLPYLMEYPYEGSEQIFSRLYANLIAAHILKTTPRLKAVLAEWTRQAQTGTAAQQNDLASKLAQNQELKNLLLQETPWVRDAQGETERLARLSTLFDETRLRTETARALAQLRKMQHPNGAFPWFERMPADRYITQLIVTGFGKLNKLGVFDASRDGTGRALLTSAIGYLDEALARDYADLRRQKGVKLAENHLYSLPVQALYARSYWPQPPVAGAAKAAYQYYQTQAATYWSQQPRYLQAQLALSLFRLNKTAPAAQEIMQALSENALHSPEFGMYWKEVRGGYYWTEARTETQATLIEAFDEVKNDQKAVDEMKLWLLKQKQTHSWESTRATADACYALLLRGSDWLVPTQPLQISVGSETIKPEATQAGTGYFKTNWQAADVQPAQGKVSLTKPDAGVAWGALYWQYFEDIDKVTPAATPLSLERQLYRETRTAGGPVLEKLTATAPLKVGEALVVRLVLRTDRALEYVHLKDQRAAGLEPIGQTSGYRYQNGLGYYESPRDAATNFFLSEVQRGTHVFEYRLRASQAGDFSGGLSQIQCLYAPEFGANSAGQRLVISR